MGRDQFVEPPGCVTLFESGTQLGLCLARTRIKHYVFISDFINDKSVIQNMKTDICSLLILHSGQWLGLMAPGFFTTVQVSNS